MTNPDRLRESELGRAKSKRSFFHRLTNVSLKRHRSDTGLVEDRTSSVTIVRIIVGLLMIHLIIIGGVLLRGQMVKDGTGGIPTSSAVTPPPSPLTPPPGVAAEASQDALPQPTAMPIAPIHAPVQATHITQAAPEDETAVDPDTEPTVISSPIAHDAAPQAPAAEPLRHRVAPGDTVFRIANQYGISEAALREANPSLNQGVLRAGATLTIPAADSTAAVAHHPAPATPAPARERTAVAHTQPNPTTASAAPAQPAAAPKVHIVKRGENLTIISRKVKVSTKELMEINGLKNPNRIKPGMELRLSR